LEGIRSGVLEEVRQDLSARYGSLSVAHCFMAASNTFLVGSSPKTVKEVSAVRKLDGYPVFGSIKTRKNLVKVVNSAISSWCDLNKYAFYNPYFDPSDRANMIYMRDGVHLTDPKAIRDNVSELVSAEVASHV